MDVVELEQSLPLDKLIDYILDLFEPGVLFLRIHPAQLQLLVQESDCGGELQVAFG